MMKFLKDFCAMFFMAMGSFVILICTFGTIFWVAMKAATVFGFLGVVGCALFVTALVIALLYALEEMRKRK